MLITDRPQKGSQPLAGDVIGRLEHDQSNSRLIDRTEQGLLKSHISDAGEMNCFQTGPVIVADVVVIPGCSESCIATQLLHDGLEPRITWISSGLRPKASN